MFNRQSQLSLDAHRAIVEAKDQQIEALTKEVAYWRAIALGSEEPQPTKHGLIGRSLAPAPSFEDDFDAAWSDDDRSLFNQWSAEQPEFRQGVNMRRLYQSKFGSQTPLVALTI